MRPYLKLLSDNVRSKNERIFIFFSKQGLYFLFSLFLLFLISITYGNSMAYLALFLFFSTLSLSAIITNENLRGIEIKNTIKKVIGEDFVKIPFRVINNGKTVAVDIELEIGGQSFLIPKDASTLSVDLKLTPGIHQIKRVRLISQYPFGLFYSWKNFSTDINCFIIPYAKDHLNLNLYIEKGAHYINPDGEFLTILDDRENREVQKIDWKYYAKTGELFYKIFDKPKDTHLIIDEKDLLGLDAFKKIEQIHFLAKEARIKGVKFQLKLKNYESSLDCSTDELYEVLASMMKEVYEPKNL